MSRERKVEGERVEQKVTSRWQRQNEKEKERRRETRKDKEPQMRCRQIDCSHNKVEIGTDRKTAKGREIEKTITF